ncbi:hypothetical protein APT58_12050 [Corynebacterium glutamicum]|nr:hypothetical protein APT58_12050 [Corynebacterium glutamicum]
MNLLKTPMWDVPDIETLDLHENYMRLRLFQDEVFAEYVDLTRVQLAPTRHPSPEPVDGIYIFGPKRPIRGAGSQVPCGQTPNLRRAFK